MCVFKWFQENIWIKNLNQNYCISINNINNHSKSNPTQDFWGILLYNHYYV